MPRFFAESSDIYANVIVLGGEDAGHIRVLRMRPGEEFTVCDGQGTDYLCRLRSLNEDGAEAEILSSAASVSEPSVSCTIYAGFPKGDKAEFIIQKGVENGAASFVFFPSSRCVARPEGAQLARKLERWQKISDEAAKQSGRGRLPHVFAAASFSEAMDMAAGAELPLFMYETGDYRVSMREALSESIGKQTVSIVTGPEGGFSPDEAELARGCGLISVSLGPRILRCETAPVTALAAVMYETGNM